MAHYKGTNKEGKRADDLARSREQMAHDFQAKVEAIKKENAQGLKNMDESFQSTSSVLDEAFKASTVGLVTADDFRKKREQLEAAKKAEAERDELAAKRAKKKREAERKAKLSTLSFDVGEEVEADGGGEAEEKDQTKEDEEQAKKKRKIGKNPDVDTSFLRDPEREAADAALREQLAKEYAAQQEKIKQEQIEVTYSYWDGSGHRRSINITKGTRIEQFLEKCRRDLSDAFHELRGTSSENLIYVKEDLIIPHHYTFYDLIVTKARGKSGPLFHFDVHDDVRLTMNAHIEKDESHAGKVLTRAYYERNKHIFPASRWEVYDPSVKRDKYTIG